MLISGFQDGRFDKMCQIRILISYYTSVAYEHHRNKGSATSAYFYLSKGKK